MATREITGLGLCEITRMHGGSFAVTLPNGDTAIVEERADGSCGATVTAGKTQGWQVAMAFTNHLRAKKGIPAPEPELMLDDECDGYGAEQDGMNRRILGRLGFRAAVQA